MQKKSAPVGKPELVPTWFPARHHQKVELAKLGQSEGFLLDRYKNAVEGTE